MKHLLTVFLTVACLSLYGQQEFEFPFRNPDLSSEERIDNLIELLTPDEKIGMMMHASQAVPRLGIPAYNWWNEALHGVARAGLATVFPQAIGMAATWNVKEHLKTFDIISDEARAKYYDAVRNNNRGIYRGLSFWTPNINIFRDPRWGRGQETYGEDPYLTSKFGVAAVRGLQGDDETYFKTYACAKHYAVHSGPEWNRHSYNAQVSNRDLWETYLPAFKALVCEANVREVMCAYNAFEGEPCCASNKLLMDILRHEWGYDGIVVTDCWAMHDFYREGRHQTHANPAVAAADAVIHSSNLECGETYGSLKEALETGLITIEQINTSLRPVLQGWIELGMFDPPELIPWNNYPYSIVNAPEHQEHALKVTRESMTLLKNDGVLPLSKKIKKLAVLGSNAADSIALWGNYNGIPSSTVTILDGIKAKLPNTEIVYEKACELADPWVRTSLYEHLYTDIGESQGLKVEFFNNNQLEGESAVTLINKEEIKYNTSGGTILAPGVNLFGTSTRITGVLVAPFTGQIEFSVRASENCNLYIDDERLDSRSGRHAPWIHTMEVKEGQAYTIKLEQRQSSRDVEIDFAVFRKSKADFSSLVERIKDVDAIIYVGGLSPRLEGEEMRVDFPGFKGGDRTVIELPDVQRQLLQSLQKTAKPVVFVLMTGSALGLEDVENNYNALLCAWYGGQAAGTAVADVLFGDYNPAGRLPVTFYSSTEQLDKGLSKHDDPARQGFENYDMEGRTYRYMKEKPLYPFGHGLSYADFTYGEPVVKTKIIKAQDGLTVTVPVTNTSSYAGDEVIQVYVKRNDDLNAPVKSLRAFDRVHFEPGETKNVDLYIDSGSFEFYDEKVDGMVLKPGVYTIYYGGTSLEEDQMSFQLTVEV